jgi:hypothetical protein
VHDNPLDHADSSIVVIMITAHFVRYLAKISGLTRFGYRIAPVRICHKADCACRLCRHWLSLSGHEHAKQACAH